MEEKKTLVIIVIIATILFAIVTAVIVLDKKSPKENNTASETTDEELDYLANAERQMSEPKEGETIAIMHVKDYGDITFKFFENEAPKSVENFVTHAKDGYYNGLKFYKALEDLYIQSGDPKGNGMGGESIWNEDYDEQYAVNLVPYKGALCMAKRGNGSSLLGSQFFIVQANADDTAKARYTKDYSANFAESYLKYGGIPEFYKKYVVFGQVIDGMDIVDKIGTTQKKQSSTGELSIPKEDIIIESIEIKTK